MFKRILFLIVLGTYILPKSSLAEELPKDPRYWKYHNWYVSHSVLNLVVDGTDEKHLSEILAEIPKLKARGILIGDVMIIGTPFKDSKLDSLARSVGLDRYNMENASYVVDKYDISNSPTWIVRHRGREYVFEGFRSAQNLYTSQGIFKGEDF